MAGTEETRASKSYVWKNGALLIKVPPSNMRGIHSGGAHAINKRTDYSVASTFSTNQKTMMHGLINSRAADLRKIKLRRLLRRLLQRGQNKDHSKNYGISEPQGSLMF